MNRKLWLGVFGILFSLAMAFLLRDVVDQVIIRPAAYFLWVLGTLYRMIPQPVLWFLLVLVLVYLAIGRLARLIDVREPMSRRDSPISGPVRELALQIERKEGGVYFKWKIANILGQLALEIQELRFHNVKQKLELDQKKILPEVRDYLEAGLYTNFTDYPFRGGLASTWLSFLPKRLRSLLGITDSLIAITTPFDNDISLVIEYLEQEMENDDGFRRA